MQSEREATRYLQIVDFFRKYGKYNPSILDIGCGDGVLNRRMTDFEFHHFTGVDFSSESIRQAQAMDYPKAEFVTADAIEYQPEQSYDIIIFNEAFYYIPDSKKPAVMDRMLAHLNPDGLLIVSIFREGVGCWEYFKEEPRLAELDFVTVTTDKETTYWKIGAYRLK
ncbi:class I SAM-dependent methyltransferase [Aureitalea marina]|uniref:class I SAM-dependent methyltransferase n=1 Tax=Aureitalea marina TaxID=930804 RepID=UPI001FE9E8F7|nr:class I SAM-dependent methyltransferase [Aureitalea marina]